MFACSVAAYLLIRRAGITGMPTTLQNLSCFIVPFLVYVPFVLVQPSRLAVTGYQAFIIIASAFLFSYLGSKFSFESLKYAPNPGYSLVLSKSYVLMTSLVAVIFFHSVLTARAMGAIVMIVVFSAMIMIDPKVHHAKTAKSIWLPYALGAFFCWGMLALSSKYLLVLGVSIYTRLIYTMAIVSVCILWEMGTQRVSLFKLSIENRVLFILIGVLFAGSNYFMQLGFALAPNIGYVNAINAASIACVTIGAVIFFHDDLTPRKMIGVVGVVIGLIVLVI